MSSLSASPWRTVTRWTTSQKVGHSCCFRQAGNDLELTSSPLAEYYQALEHGSVPLVLGAPNFESFLPTPNAAINIANYLPSSYSAPSASNSSAPTELTAEAKEGLARLAERLRYLGSEQGRTEYEEALAWKLDDAWTTSPLGKVVGLGRERWSTECRLAGLLRGEEWAKPSWVPHRDGRN